MARKKKKKVIENDLDGRKNSIDEGHFDDVDNEMIPIPATVDATHNEQEPSGNQILILFKMHYATVISSYLLFILNE